MYGIVRSPQRFVIVLESDRPTACTPDLRAPIHASVTLPVSQRARRNPSSSRGNTSCAKRALAEAFKGRHRRDVASHVHISKDRFNICFGAHAARSVQDGLGLKQTVPGAPHAMMIMRLGTLAAAFKRRQRGCLGVGWHVAKLAPRPQLGS